MQSDLEAELRPQSDVNAKLGSHLTEAEIDPQSDVEAMLAHQSNFEAMLAHESDVEDGEILDESFCCSPKPVPPPFSEEVSLLM